MRHIISLGCHCEPAHQLGRMGLRTLSPFEWLVTPHNSLITILGDDGARLGTEFVASHDGKSVRCGIYDVLYHHEFQRDAEERIIFNADAIENCRSRLHHKMSRMIAACEDGDPVLFVRIGPRTDLAWETQAPLVSNDINALVGALAGRFPRLAFRLLMIVRDGAGAHDFSAPIDPRVSLHFSPRLLPAVLGDDGEWGCLLQQDSPEAG